MSQTRISNMGGGGGGGGGVTTTPGGLDTQVQFNDGGAFGGNAGLTYNKTTSLLTAANVNVSGLTASRAIVTDSSKNLVSSAATATEVGYLSGVTSAIQTQIDAKVTGPGSSTDNAVARFDGTTGKLIQNSGVIINDANGISLTIAASGNSSGLRIVQNDSVTDPNAIEIVSVSNSGAFYIDQNANMGAGAGAIQIDNSGNGSTFYSVHDTSAVALANTALFYLTSTVSETNVPLMLIQAQGGSTTQSVLTLKQAGSGLGLSVGDTSTSNFEVNKTGDFRGAGYLRVGSTTAPTDTTAGSIYGTQMGLGTTDPDEMLHLVKSTGNFTTVRFDSGTTQGYFFAYDGDSSVNFGSNSAAQINLRINNSTVASLLSGGNFLHSGYLRVGSLSAPSNTTAGDFTTIRGFFTGAVTVDGHFTANAARNSRVFRVFNDTSGDVFYADAGANNVQMNTATSLLEQQTTKNDGTPPFVQYNTTVAANADVGFKLRINAGGVGDATWYLGIDNTDDKFKISPTDHSTPALSLDTSGNGNLTGYLYVGSQSAPSNTTAGDITGVRLFAGTNQTEFTIASTGALTITPSSSPTLSVNLAGTITTASVNARSIGTYQTFNGTGDGPAGAEWQPTFAPGGNLSAAYSFINLPVVNIAGGRTITNLYASYNSSNTGSGGGAITNLYTIAAIAPTYGTTKPNGVVGIEVQNHGSASITTAVGVRIALQSGATTNYALQLSDTGGTAAGGITFGTDTNLYRSAADTLKTDDNFIVTRELTAKTVKGTDWGTIFAFMGS